jgi:hypothetical protein
MSKIDFENMLNKHNEKPKQEDINWVKEKEEWLTFIKQFYDSIERWLKPYSEKGQLSYEYEKITLTEEDIGSYEVNVMKIIFAGQHIKLMPIGTLLIGTKGRIDMEGARGRVQFMLAKEDSKGIGLDISVTSRPRSGKSSEMITYKTNNWIWKIVLKESRKIAFEDFTEENFFSALMEVSNG